MKMNQFLAASALLLCFACAKEESVDNQDRIENVSSAVQEQNDEPGQQPEEEGDGSVVMTFGARIAEPEEYIQPPVEQPDPSEMGEGDGEEEEVSDEEETKTHLGTLSDGKYPNYWSVGDKVKINADESAPLGEEYATPSKSARFPMVKWVDKYEGYYHVGYPADAFAFSDGVGTVTLSSTQTYVAGSYDPEAFVLIGKSEEEELAFIPVMGLLRVTAKNADGGGYGSKIASVTLQSIGGEALSGTFTTDYTNGSSNFFKASVGNPSVTINAPTDAGLDFGTQFFFCIPAGTYASGLRFIVTTLDGKSMVFSNAASYTVSVGKASNIGSPKYEPSPTSLPKPTLWEITSSTISVDWVSHIPANDYGKRWRIVVSTDAGSQDVVRDYIIPAKAGCWTTNETPLRFSVGRLNPGGTYYVKVVDVGNNIESAVSSPITLSSFTPIEMPAADITTTGVKFAENFGECGWGSSYYNEVYVGGFYPVTNSAGDSVGQEPFSTLTTGAKYTAYHRGSTDWHFRFARFNTAYDESRMKNWYYAGDAYFKNGYIKLGTTSSTGYLLTPAIPLADGKTARVDVTVKAAKYSEGSSDTWAVFVVSDATVKTPGKTPAGRLATFTWPSTSDPTLYQTFTLSSSEWSTQTISGLYVTNGDRIVVGLVSGGSTASGAGRINCGALSIDVKEITDDFIIRDATTLDAFNTLIADAETAAVKGTNARVVNDIDASSLAGSWTPIAGYTGTLKGGDKEISGLTKPFFDDLQGTVRNLTLDSDVAESSEPNVGMFARTLAATSASSGLYNCTAKSGSSVTGTYTAAFSANACIGGLVGQVSQGGTLNNCVNNATVSVTNTTATSAYDIYVGGIAGYTVAAWSGETLTAAATLTDCVNNGDITNGASTTTDAVRMCIGGAFGLATASNLTRCANTAEVRNNGASEKTTSIGGICGSTLRSNNTPCVLSACYNTGAVKNYGVATDSNNLTLRLGGLVGWIDQQNTLEGTSSLDCNYNNGPVTDYSGSSRPAIGGICGYVNNADTTLDYCENRSGGVITTSWADKTIGYQVYVGGVIGYCNVAITLSHVSNAANINMTTTTTTNDAVLVGGVVGYINNTTAATSDISNSGSITVSNLSCQNFYAGGLMGYNKGSTSGDCSNGETGDLSISVDASGNNLYAGGLFGKSDGAITGASGTRIVNRGDVTIQSGSVAKQCLVAGIVGRHSDELSYCTNYGAISNSANTTSYMYVSGVSAYASAAISNCINEQTVTNAGDASANVLRVGGIAAYNDHAMSVCENKAKIENSGDGPTCYLGGVGGEIAANMTTCVNSAIVKNASGTFNTIHQGGVAGYTTGSLTSCSNTNAVSNLADAANYINVGGGFGTVSGGTLTTCYNTGAVSNSGDASGEWTTAEPPVEQTLVTSVRAGGLVGFATGAVTMSSSSSSNCNYNNGTVEESSETRKIAVGGVCALADNASSTFAYCQNRSGGDITVKNEHYEFRVGGVVGCSKEAAVIDHAANAGDIIFDGATINTDGQIFAGGVLGKWENSTVQTISYCVNNGNIKTKVGNIDSTDIMPQTDDPSYSYFGGIVGTGINDNQNKTYTYCKNDGDIILYTPIKLRAGGIAAIIRANPSYCVSLGDITHISNSDVYKVPKRSDIGGIAGYAHKDVTAFSNLTYKGTIVTYTSQYAAYNGGLIGRVPKEVSSPSFDSCTVGGTFSGASTPGKNGAGVFMSTNADSGQLPTFSSCVIESGVRVRTSSSSSGYTTFTTMASIMAETYYLVGMKGADSIPDYSSGKIVMQSVTWPSIPQVPNIP